jgi:beta-lactamase superfamily II metal-dependent hydrolase
MNSEIGFEIDLLTVGNNSKGGDAIALRFGKLNQPEPDQKVVIIDGGYKDTGKKLIELVKNTYKTNTIDLILLTHPDKDHSSGLRELFDDDELRIKKLVMHRPWLNDKINTSYFKDKRKTENSLNKVLQKAFYFAFDLSKLAIEKIGESNISEPKVGSEYLDGVIKILGPTFELYKKSLIKSDKTPEQLGIVAKQKQFSASSEFEYENYKEGDEINWYHDETTSPVNETSIVTLFDYSDNKMLLTGDTGKEGLKNASDYAKSKNIDLKNLKVFQVPHHGSRKNISPELLELFGANFYFISVPPNGDPKHPSRRLINLMNQKGLNIHKTGGKSLHWGTNCPNRNWKSSDRLNSYSKIEK